MASWKPSLLPHLVYAELLGTVTSWVGGKTKTRCYFIKYQLECSSIVCLTINLNTLNYHSNNDIANSSSTSQSCYTVNTFFWPMLSLLLIKWFFTIKAYSNNDINWLGNENGIPVRKEQRRGDDVLMELVMGTTIYKMIDTWGVWYPLLFGPCCFVFRIWSF